MITLTLLWLKQLQAVLFSYSYALLSLLFFFAENGPKNLKKSQLRRLTRTLPVYDMYYFADGDRIDYGNVEVEDENQMYGT